MGHRRLLLVVLVYIRRALRTYGKAQVEHHVAWMHRD
jgi:hypothetical protein